MFFFREEIRSVQDCLKKIQAGANNIRKEGAVRNGTVKVMCLCAVEKKDLYE